jgi:hypothetical protein
MKSNHSNSGPIQRCDLLGRMRQSVYHAWAVLLIEITLSRKIIQYSTLDPHYSIWINSFCDHIDMAGCAGLRRRRGSQLTVISPIACRLKLRSVPVRKGCCEPILAPAATPSVTGGRRSHSALAATRRVAPTTARCLHHPVAHPNGNSACGQRLESVAVV